MPFKTAAELQKENKDLRALLDVDKIALNENINDMKKEITELKKLSDVNKEQQKEITRLKLEAEKKAGPYGAPMKPKYAPFVNCLEEKVIRKDKMWETYKDLESSRLIKEKKRYFENYNRACSEFLTNCRRLEDNKWIMLNGKTMNKAEQDKYMGIKKTLENANHKPMPLPK